MGIAEKRYSCYYIVDGDDCSFWFSQTGHTVRWVVFLAIILVVFLWVVGGYYHAKVRLRKGLPPLAYHRCLVARRPPPPPQTYQTNAGPYGYYSQDAYNMNHMPPPPVYDGQRPPEYPAAPPDGGSKIDPSQWRAEPTRRPPESSSAAQGLGDVEAPAGPPPGQRP